MADNYRRAKSKNIRAESLNIEKIEPDFSSSEFSNDDIEKNIKKPKKGQNPSLLKLLCPLVKKRFYRPASVDLRRMFIPLLIMHVSLLLINNYLYGALYFNILLETVFIWLSFINYLHLDKICIVI